MALVISVKKGDSFSIGDVSVLVEGVTPDAVLLTSEALFSAIITHQLWAELFDGVFVTLSPKHGLRGGLARIVVNAPNFVVTNHRKSKEIV